MMRISLGTVRAVIPMLLAAVLVSCTALVQARPLAGPDTLPPLPAGWSTTLQLGMSSQPGDATAMAATAPFGLRSQYLAGGVNTGGGWATWGADGAFVADYARESASQGMRSVFDYYMLLHSQPASGADEAGKVSSNLTNVATMTAYYADLKLFYLKVAPFAQTGVILHAEPDLWGYLQQRSRGDDGASVPAVVASSGLPELADLPNTAAGFAQAFIALRDRYAPGVQVAYHLSVWGTGKDILYSRPADATVDELADRAAAFYRSLGARFDLAFADPTDRDAAFKQYQYGDRGRAWWTAADYARNARFIGTFVAGSGRRVVLWQTPLGNTKMRAMNNDWDHYQDNHVEWLLDEASRPHLLDYANAGVIGIIFGRGADGATCACDAAGDGVTDPAPINGNALMSLSADDDGGYFRARAAGYYAAGPLPLPTGTGATPGSTPSSVPTRK